MSRRRPHRRRRLSRPRRHADGLHAPAALGLQSVLSRLGAQEGRHHRRSPDAHRRHGHGERRLGRRRRLSAVRDDVGDRDLSSARRVSRRAARVRRSLRRARTPGCERRARRARRSAPRPRVARAHVPRRQHDVQPARRRSRSHVLRSDHDRQLGLRLGKGRRAAGVSVHRKAAGHSRQSEPLDGLRVDRGKDGGGIRARRATARRLAIARSPTRCAGRRSPHTRSACSIPASVRPRRAPRPTSTKRTTGRTTWSSARRCCIELTRRASAIGRDAIVYARREPVTPWMGADTARHYQWYPWHNAGHYEAWTRGRSDADAPSSPRFIATASNGWSKRATNGFRVGIPFIWCSNDLMVSFATQARSLPADDGRHALSRIRAGGDRLAVRHESVGNVDGDRCSSAAASIRTIRTPSFRSAMLQGLTGGLVDGPVYASIFRNLQRHQPA